MRSLGIIALCMTLAAVSQTTIDRDPRDLIKAAITRPWPGENYPALPALTSQVLVTIRGQDPVGLKNGVKQWRNWLPSQDIIK